MLALRVCSTSTSTRCPSARSRSGIPTAARCNATSWFPSKSGSPPDSAWLCRGGPSYGLLPMSRPSNQRGEYRVDNYQSLNHSKWNCKYHVVFIPKYRRKALYVVGYIKGKSAIHLARVYGERKRGF